MKILISAFSCAPWFGSEPAIAWGVIRRLSANHALWVLTDVHNRPYIEAALARSPLPSVRFTFVRAICKIEPARAAGWVQGLHYLLWQLYAFFAAAALHRRIRFDLAHHITYGSSWLPSLLGWLPIPFLWSAGARETTPWNFYGVMSWRSRVAELMRSSAVFFLGSLTRVLTASRARLILSPSSPAAWGAGLPVQRFALGGLQPEEIDLLRAIPERCTGAFRAASIGRLLGWKGFALGIEAFTRLHRDHPDCEYWIFGDGPERRHLENLARRRGCASAVKFWGVLSRGELMQQLAEIDVLVHPSLHEQFGYALLEGMAAGKPVIALDVGGPRRLVQEEGGRLIPRGKPEQVIRDIHRWLEHMAQHPAERREKGANARRWACERWNWESVGERLFKFYERTARPAGSGYRAPDGADCAEPALSPEANWVGEP